jgi:hypothetical protein
VIDDAVEAGEMLILASHLLPIDDRAARLAASSTSTPKAIAPPLRRT